MINNVEGYRCYSTKLGVWYDSTPIPSILTVFEYAKNHRSNTTHHHDPPARTVEHDSSRKHFTPTFMRERTCISTISATPSSHLHDRGTAMRFHSDLNHHYALRATLFVMWSEARELHILQLLSVCRSTEAPSHPAHLLRHSLGQTFSQ